MADFQQLLENLSPEKRALLAQRLRERGKSGDTRPLLERDEKNRYEPFPLTDLQQAYWIGRAGVFDVGDVATHAYLEFETTGLSLEGLQDALRRVIARHDALRSVVRSGEAQQTLPEVPDYEIACVDLRQSSEEAQERAILKVRDTLSHQVLDVDTWPLFDIRAVELPDNRLRVFLSMDALIFDARSIFIFLDEWANEYFGVRNAAPPALTFRDYVVHEAGAIQTKKLEDAAYWRQRVQALPPSPELPTGTWRPGETTLAFVRRHRTVDAARWQVIKDRAAKAGLTTTGVLLAAYADVVSYWSQSRHFTLNVPQFNRDPVHPSVNQIVGEFASFTLLEVDNRGPDGFTARAKRHQARLWEDLEHSAFSGVEVLRELAKRMGGAGNATMPVVFTALPLAESVREGVERFGPLTYAINQSSQVWLDNHVGEYNGELTIDWDSVDALFPRDLSRDMLDAFIRLLHTLADDASSWERSLEQLADIIVPPHQLAQRNEVNGQPAPIENVPVHTLFERRALQQGGHAAVVCAGQSLSYEQLLKLCQQWARRLQESGVGPGARVAIVMEKGWEQVVAALSVLFAGGAYVPLDADNPTERLHAMLSDADPIVTLTQVRLRSAIPWPEGTQVVGVDVGSVADYDDGPLRNQSEPEDLAYILYTSGSTGAPKGVMIQHRGMVNAISQTIQHFRIGPGDIVLGVTALHHDMSTFDIFGMLAAGGTVVLPEAGQRRDPDHWMDLMQRHRVTVWNSVPAMMDMLLEYLGGVGQQLPPSLRWAFLGGDWIAVTIPERIGAMVPGCKVVSVGGPTETTLWNIWYVVDNPSPTWSSIPYGFPIANTAYHILHEDMTPCPDWVRGEMFVSGVGVAAGYWRADEQTREKFLTHPVTGERLYRTGDTGCYWPDGNIEFKGRADFQVKIQGQRIELGEIESALQRSPDVQAAVVDTSDSPGNRRFLVAYVVITSDGAFDEARLQNFLRDRVPPYMVPAQFVRLDQVPLNANGKVDRRALPRPTVTAGTSSSSGPDDGRVRDIVGIVEEVLGVSDIPGDGNLLAFGANSIDMVKIGNRLERHFGSRPRIDELFRLQTPKALAAYYDEKLGTSDTEGADGLVSVTPNRKIEALITTIRVLLDPDERDQFKATEPGRRRFDSDRTTIQLASDTLDDRWTERRSHRQFSLKPIRADQFGRFLQFLARHNRGSGAGYVYPSPGGLYPTQLYVHFKPGRVDGVDGGTYYHEPSAHQLVQLVGGVDIDRSIHIPFINTPIYDEAAFSLYLITQIKAIAPGYGDRSLHFATLEAGCMAMLLELVGPSLGIGLCQIGGIDFDRIRHLFELDEGHVLVHSLVGGAVAEAVGDRVPGDSVSEEARRASDLLNKVRSLSPDEIKAMLAAKRRARLEGTDR